MGCANIFSRATTSMRAVALAIRRRISLSNYTAPSGIAAQAPGSQERAHIRFLYASLQPLDAVYDDHRDTIPIALEQVRIAPDIDLLDVDLVVGGKFFQMAARLITQ